MLFPLSVALGSFVPYAILQPSIDLISPLYFLSGAASISCLRSTMTHTSTLSPTAGNHWAVAFELSRLGRNSQCWHAAITFYSFICSSIYSINAMDTVWEKDVKVERCIWWIFEYWLDLLQASEELRDMPASHTLSSVFLFTVRTCGIWLWLREHYQIREVVVEQQSYHAGEELTELPSLTVSPHVHSSHFACCSLY